MTREEALNEIRSWAIPSEKGREVLETLIPELVESENERMYARVTGRYTRFEKYYFRALGETEANKVLKQCEEEELWIKNLLEKQKDLDKMIVVSPEVWDKAISGAFENGKKDNEKQKEQKHEVKYVYPKFRVGDEIVEVTPNGYCPPVVVKYIGEGSYSCESKDGKRFLSFPIKRENEYRLVEQKPTEKQDYSGLNDLEKAIHRGFLAADVENVPVRIIKEIAQDCLVQTGLIKWELPKDFEEAVYKVVNFVSPFSSEEELREISHRFAIQLLSLAKEEAQKSTWSEDDENMLYDIRENYKLCIYLCKSQIEWIESLKHRIQLQSKQEWSEDDDATLSWCISDIERAKYCKSQTKPELCDIEINWLKSLPERFSLQPKQEWSEEDKGLLLSTKCIIDEVWHSENTFGYSKEELEEIWNWLNVAWTRLEYPEENNEWSKADEKNLNEIIHFFESLCSCLATEERHAENRKWLKFLKSLRPQPHWKPSKEQITAIEAAYSVLNSHDTWGEDEHLPTIMSLINDLQKLL